MQEGPKPLPLLTDAEITELYVNLGCEPEYDDMLERLCAQAKLATRPADSPKAAKVEDEYEGDTAKGWYEAWTRENDAWQKMVQHHEELEDAVKILIEGAFNATVDTELTVYTEHLEAVRQIIEVEGSAPAALQPKPEAEDWLTREQVEAMLGLCQDLSKVTLDERMLDQTAKLCRMALAALTPSPKDDGTIRAQLEALERMGRVVAEAAKREKQLLKLLKPDCWQPYQADDSSQSYSGPDECLDDYYNDHENLLVGDIVFIEAVCIRKQAWRLDAQANAEEGDGPMWSLVMDEGAPQAEPIGEREDG